MLEETATLLAGSAQTALLAITEGAPLPKPADHKGGRDTDMFEITLSSDLVGWIVEVVEAAARCGASTPRSNKIGGFAIAWRELLAHLLARARATGSRSDV